MISGTTLNPGLVTGRCLTLTRPLSLWGGTDANGTIVETRHPQFGARISGRILVMESGRGSSSSASVLAEQIRAGTAPAGIVLGAVDAILALGAMVAQELYGIDVPIVVVPPDALAQLADGTPVTITATDAGCRIETSSG